MTRDEILEMPVGRKMDALVAELMGLDIFPRDNHTWRELSIDERDSYQSTFYCDTCNTSSGWVSKQELGSEKCHPLYPFYSRYIEAALPMAEKLELTLVPIPVYETEYEWDFSRGQPIKTWWAAFHATSGPSVYLPIEQYNKEWKGWIDIIDDRITLDMVSETLPLAICRAALLAKMEVVK